MSIDPKLDALQAHESAVRVDDEGHRRRPQLAAFRERIRHRLRTLGEPLGLAAAELFKRVDDI